MKLLTTILATETSVISFQQLHGYMKDNHWRVWL